MKQSRSIVGNVRHIMTKFTVMDASNKLEYAVLHCSATPAGRELSKDQLAIMHLGTLVLKDKNTGQTIGYRHKKKVYQKLEDLPQVKIGGIFLADIAKAGGGKDWSQFGYNKFQHLDGTWETLVPYDNDGEVDPWEITNGLSSTDKQFFKSLNFMYVGGCSKNSPYTWEDTRTTSQNQGQINLVHELITTFPDIKIIGHNQIATDQRSCPSFNVPEWLRKNGFPERNIAQEPVKFLGKLNNAF